MYSTPLDATTETWFATKNGFKLFRPKVDSTDIAVILRVFVDGAQFISHSSYMTAEQAGNAKAFTLFTQILDREHALVRELEQKIPKYPSLFYRVLGADLEKRLSNRAINTEAFFASYGSQIESITREKMDIRAEYFDELVKSEISVNSTPLPLIPILGTEKPIFANCAYFAGQVYTTRRNLDIEGWKKLISDAAESRSIAASAPAISAKLRRQAIPDRVKHEVWRRDQGMCTRCGSRANLEYDHIIPVSMGGSNTVRNIELLCERCNRTKGANLSVPARV